MGLERVFAASWTLRDLRRPPLGSFLDDFCDWLLEHGFTWYTVRVHLGRILHLGVSHEPCPLSALPGKQFTVGDRSASHPCDRT